MVHKAFDEVCVVSGCPSKIDTAICFQSNVYVGCSDGSLRIYSQLQQPEQLENSPSSSPSNARYSLKQTIVGFAKKPVSQMELIVNKSGNGMLISLAESVAIHTLPGLEPVAFLTKTKGASIFCWDDHQGLCVAKHKRLHIYRHDGSRGFTEETEISSPDVVKSMVWTGNSVCIGTKREYLLLNVVTGATTDLFPCGRVAAPLVVSLPRGELVLGKDNIGVFVDQAGKATQQGALSWSESPSAVMVHEPYILARLSRFIEVRSLEKPYNLVQMIPHKDMHLLQSSGFGLLAASETSVYKLLPVEIGVQVVQLAASGKFKDALAMCKRMPPEDAAVRKSKEDRIHVRYGLYLYGQGQYAEALQHFSSSTLSLSTIIFLFPAIKLPKFCAENGLKELDLGDDFEPEKLVSKAASLSALATFLMNRRGEVIDRAETEDTNEAVAALVETNASRKNFKHDVRPDDPRETARVLDSALVQALLLTNQSSMAIKLLEGSNYCDVDACEELMMSGGHYKALVELYRYKKLHKEALHLLERLIENPQLFPVPPPEGQFTAQAIVEYLQPLGTENPHFILDFSTLVLRLCPEQAIKLFTSTKPPLPSNLVLSKLKEHTPELQIVYLEEMVKHNPNALPEVQNELITLYLNQAKEELAKPNSEEAPKAKSKLLTALESFNAYDPQEIHRQLPRNGLHEERALLFGKMGQHQLALSIYMHELHDQQKALAYCDSVFESMKTEKRNLLGDRVTYNVYSALLKMYLNPKASYRDHERIMAGLGLKSKPRAGLKTGRAKGHVALIEEFENPEESSKSDTEESVDGRSSPEEVMLDEAIDLLRRKWNCFDASHVLKLLPSKAKLEDLFPFLEPLLRRSTERSRVGAVISNVQHINNIKACFELQQCRKRRVKHTAETSCAICHKRIGPSAFVVYPTGAFAHVLCYTENRGRRV